MREIHTYTTDEDRTIAHEGTFLLTNDIQVGDHILVHHICKHTNANLLFKVVRKRIAYHFNGTAIYDYIVPHGSSYKSNLKHISTYDQIAKKDG